MIFCYVITQNGKVIYLHIKCSGNIKEKTFKLLAGNIILDIIFLQDLFRHFNLKHENSF